MRHVTLVMFLLAWCAALAFAAWLLHVHGHDVWAAVVPLAGVGSFRVRVSG